MSMSNDASDDDQMQEEEEGEQAQEQDQISSSNAASPIPITTADIRTTDILCGRGRHSRNTGNNSYLALIFDRKAEYHDAGSRKEKNRIAREIMDHVHMDLSPPGRFLQVVCGSAGEPDAIYQEAPEVIAIEKIKQALRQKASFKNAYDCKSLIRFAFYVLYATHFLTCTKRK